MKTQLININIIKYIHNKNYITFAINTASCTKTKN